MKVNTKKLKFLYWLPRLLAIIFIAFLAIFALDVFIPGKTVGDYLIAFFVHLIPNFVLGVLLFIAWKHEKSGGILFLLVAVAFTLVFKTYMLLINFLIVSAPIFLIGALFLLHTYLVHKR